MRSTAACTSQLLLDATRRPAHLGAAPARVLAQHPGRVAEGILDASPSSGRVERRGRSARASTSLRGDELRQRQHLRRGRRRASRRAAPRPRRCSSSRDRSRRRRVRPSPAGHPSPRTLSSIRQRSSGFSGLQRLGLEQQRPHLGHARRAGAPAPRRPRGGPRPAASPRWAAAPRARRPSSRSSRRPPRRRGARVEPKKRKRTGSPTTTPSSCGGSSASVPSSIPKGARHSARDRRLDAGHRRHRALDADVVRARRAAADAQALAAAHERVGARAARDGEIEVGASEHAHAAARRRFASQASSVVDEPLAQGPAPSSRRR